MSYPTIEAMKELGAPMTRESFIDLEYFGNPPEHIDPETEAELPDGFQEFREVTHDEIFAAKGMVRPTPIFDDEEFGTL